MHNLHRPSAYRGAPLSLAAQNGGCCLTAGYLKWFQGLMNREGPCRREVSFRPLLKPLMHVACFPSLVSLAVSVWNRAFFLTFQMLGH